MWKRWLARWTKQAEAADTDDDDTTMKYLIVGLGNPGAQYDGTRHNVGFDVVDYLAAQKEVTYKQERYAWVGSFKHRGRTFILIKPTTYMNLSGQAVRYWMQKEKIQPDNLLVILDDLNLQFGQVRLKTKGSSGGHNGLKDIEATLQSNQYARMRIGIGDQFRKGQQVDFVLGKWTSAEEKDLSKVVEHAAKGVLQFGSIGAARAMNTFNKDVLKPTPPKSKKPETKPTSTPPWKDSSSPDTTPDQPA